VRYKKTKEARVEAREYHSLTVCDFCGQRKDEEHRYWPNQKNKDDTEVELRAKVGEIYDDDVRNLEQFDCCPVCWETKVKPALKALMVPGADMYVNRWEPYVDTARLPAEPAPE